MGAERERAGRRTSREAREAGARPPCPRSTGARGSCSCSRAQLQRRLRAVRDRRVARDPEVECVQHSCGAPSPGGAAAQVRHGSARRGLLSSARPTPPAPTPSAEVDDVAAGAADLGARIQLWCSTRTWKGGCSLAHQDCDSGRRIGLWPQGRVAPAPPPHRGGGKMLPALLLLAELEERMRRWDQLPRVTRRSVTSRSRLLGEIGAARQTGYAYGEDGAILGLTCVATGFSSGHADGGHLTAQHHRAGRLPRRRPARRPSARSWTR